MDDEADRTGGDPLAPGRAKHPVAEAVQALAAMDDHEAADGHVAPREGDREGKTCATGPARVLPLDPAHPGALRVRGGDGRDLRDVGVLARLDDGVEIAVR